MSHHVIRGRRVVFGWSPRAAGAGAPKSAAIPVGFIVRCFIVGDLFARRRQIALSSAIRQGD